MAVGYFYKKRCFGRLMQSFVRCSNNKLQEFKAMKVYAHTVPFAIIVVVEEGSELTHPKQPRTREYSPTVPRSDCTEVEEQVGRHRQPLPSLQLAQPQWYGSGGSSFTSSQQFSALIACPGLDREVSF